MKNKRLWYRILLGAGFVLVLLPLAFVLITGINLSASLAEIFISLSILSFEGCALLSAYNARKEGRSVWPAVIIATILQLLFLSRLGRM